MHEKNHLISIIIPIYNGAPWIRRCFENILKQTAIGVLKLEICVCDDCSSDNTPQLLEGWKTTFENFEVPFKMYRNEDGNKGVGSSKNKAVSISSGDFLCFQDVDDVMLPDRILKQYERALEETTETIIGCQFKREPQNSTVRYTNWANTLTPAQLNLQVFTSHGPTVIMPTWFCSRKVFDRVGGFFECKKGCPEDLVFFNKHLDLGGKIARVDEVLLVYTFHLNQTTFSIDEDTIWNIRVERLQQIVLSKWPKFTIWNAGKQGRKFYNSLSEENQEKTVAFCDVDLNKIGKKYSPFNDVQKQFGREIEIIHFRDAVPPFVICMKIDLTQGVFESNLRTLQLKEGMDYVMFS
ncbi:UDP-GlcNAc:betaGal beta-1,3-N-acetylglucosaminyltransferase-like protein 1 [Anthonomus grandis grandis]|uniref:UDP-GlcNAc:betaGal beta-1,3-N-acetylglucosaminyltransferase-like protein 1 n=1 Tax=Anthonomus grandis grandis TaxID=2921223 RepID=UPI002165E92A|nr:UDP-GlcNAc:betaGal beta-1,3-N-acetylglucosaminyltransferase-like protein 1 [Anthonomus grandis grandis]